MDITTLTAPAIAALKDGAWFTTAIEIGGIIEARWRETSDQVRRDAADFGGFAALQLVSDPEFLLTMEEVIDGMVCDRPVLNHFISDGLEPADYATYVRDQLDANAAGGDLVAPHLTGGEFFELAVNVGELVRAEWIAAGIDPTEGATEFAGFVALHLTHSVEVDLTPDEIVDGLANDHSGVTFAMSNGYLPGEYATAIANRVNATA